MKQPCPDRSRSDLRSATLAPTLWLMVACSGLFMVTAYATGPGWWSSSGAVTGNTSPNAAVAQGQLKFFTQKAVAQLNANLTNATLAVGGAGTTLNNLVIGWTNDYYTNVYTALSPKPQDRQAVTVGQLKYIASLYYSQLAAAGYTASWPGWLYPDPGNDSQLAAEGQLKTVFNFDITNTLTAPTDLTATTQSDGSVELSWQESSLNVTGFTIQRNDGSGWTNIATVGAGVNDYTVAAASAGTSGTSTFRITANNNGISSTTSASSGASLPIPGTPGSLTGQLDATNSMSLSWTACTGASAYVVQRERLDGTTWTNLATVSGTNYDDSTRTVTNSSGYALNVFGYRYRICASNSAGASSPSAVFPQTSYAVIDLSASAYGVPKYVNNLGSVVIDDLSGTNYYFWKGGTTTDIPFHGVPSSVFGPPPSTNSVPTSIGVYGSLPPDPVVVGLNNNDEVGGCVATGGDTFNVLDFNPNEYNTPNYPPSPNNPTYAIFHGAAAAKWTATGGITQLNGYSDVITGHLGTTVNHLEQLMAYTNSAWVAEPPSILAPSVGPCWLYDDYWATAINDNGVIGQGYLLGFATVYNAGGTPFGTWMSTQVETQIGLNWATGEKIGEFSGLNPSLGGASFPSYIQPANTAHLTVFKANNAGDMLVTFDTYNGSSSTGPSPFYGYWNGSSLTPYSSGNTPVDLNEAGTVVSYDTNYATVVEGLGTLATNAMPLKINNVDNGTAYGQVLDDANRLWTYNTNTSAYVPQNLPDYAPNPDSGSWCFSGTNSLGGYLTSMNDYGALIGMGTRTKNDDGSPIASTNQYIRPVMLVPISIVRETTPGSGDFEPIQDNGLSTNSTLPIFTTESGTGLAQTLSSNTLTASLSQNLSGSSTASMPITLQTSSGSYSGTLTETSAGSGVFTNTGSTVTVTLAPTTQTTSDSTVDTLNVLVTDSTLSLSSCAFTLQESSATSKSFSTLPTEVIVTLSSALSTTLVDTIKLYMSGFGNGTSLSTTLTETAINSKVFQNTSGTTVTVTNYTSGVSGSMNIAVTGSPAPATPFTATLTESSSTSLQYCNVQKSIGDITPSTPATDGQGIFYIQMPGTTATDIHLQSGSTDVTATASPVSGLTGVLRTAKLALLAPGDTFSGSGITTVSMATSTAAKLTVQLYGQTIASVPTVNNAFIGGCLHSDMPPPSMLTTIRDILAVQLGWTAPVVNEAMTKADILAAVPTHDLWYSFGHGLTHDGKNGPLLTFECWSTHSVDWFTDEVKPLDIESVNGLHEYKLVFFNSCYSADGGTASVAFQKCI